MKKEGLKNGELGEIGANFVFLSSITGLPVTERLVFPEGETSYNLKLVLGSGNERYEINIRIVFTDEWTSGEWLPVTAWNVSYNDEEIYRVGGMVDIINGFRDSDLKNTDKVGSYLLREIGFIFGGLNMEIDFIDYERYTLESLRDGDDYFRNIYLVLMTHMKQRGLSLPPILSKRPNIREAMFAGETEALDRLVAGISLFDMPYHDSRCQSHMRYEIEEIKRKTGWERRRRDPKVSLSESYPGINITKIELGKPVFPPVNILVVENDLYNSGLFMNRTMAALEKDGRYRGSALIKEFNLPSCVTLCETGKVDLVIFDWTSPSYEEALMLRGDRNPFFDMFYRNSQGVVSSDSDGQKQFGTPDGRVFDDETLKKEAEKIDIRSRWMDMIADACVNAGTTVPPHFIVRNASELSQIGVIVSQKLGHPVGR